MDMSESVNGGRAGFPKCPSKGQLLRQTALRNHAAIAPQFFLGSWPDRSHESWQSGPRNQKLISRSICPDSSSGCRKTTTLTTSA